MPVVVDEGSPQYRFVREYVAREGDAEGAAEAVGIGVMDGFDYLETASGRKALRREQRRKPLSIAMADERLRDVLTSSKTKMRERIEAIKLTYSRFGEDGATRIAEAIERGRLRSLPTAELWQRAAELGAPVDPRIVVLARGEKPRLMVPVPRASNDPDAADDALAGATGILRAGQASREMDRVEASTGGLGEGRVDTISERGGGRPGPD